MLLVWPNLCEMLNVTKELKFELILAAQRPMKSKLCSMLFDSTLVNTSLDTAVPAIESTGSDDRRYSHMARNTDVLVPQPLTLGVRALKDARICTKIPCAQ